MPMGDKIFMRQPAVEPLGDTHSSLWIYKELGKRLGLQDFFQYADEQDYIRQQLAPLGGSLEDIHQKGFIQLHTTEADEFRWMTPSGKIEIHSTTLEKGGFAAVPEWEEPPVPAADAFYLLTGKVAQQTQFASQNNQLLHKYQDEPRLWMHPQPAAERGLVDGELVTVKSKVGEVQVALEVTQAIRPDCVFLAPGNGHLSKGLRTAYGVGASDSVLHVSYTDPVSGSQALTQTFVTVGKG
jgi:thiosulfate reductase/polysulfide reductase chain A